MISLPSTVAPAGADGITLTISDIRVVGSTVYSDAELASLSANLIGPPAPLSAVYELAQKITAKYGDDGYVLSRAVVPPQDLDPEGAIVTIQVIEGYVDWVEWPPIEGYDGFFAYYSDQIVAERPANIRTVMRYLLLAGELPGLTVSSRFQASDENTGASTLIVEATEKPFSAEARIDNRGTEARGPWEYLVRGTADNHFHRAESVSLTYAGAFQVNELQYVALAYRQVVSYEGLTAFGDASYTWGTPGTTTLEALEFQSNGLAVNLGLSNPVIRSRDRNLTLSGLFFLSNDQGDVLSEPNSDDRLRGFRFIADFDVADHLNGITQVNAILSQGIDGLGSTSNDNPLASRENGRVDFTKVDGTISRVQPLDNGFSVRGAAHGQYAFTPLLAPEECGYGGKEFGRAFDPAAITGDNCLELLGELRYDVRTQGDLLTEAQLYGFVDYGSIYRIDPSAGTPKQQSASSAGFGIRFGLGEHFNADLMAAKPLSGATDYGWRYFLIARASY